MWKISQGICLLGLVELGVEDIRKKRIPGWILGVGIFVSILYQGLTREESLLVILGGAALGLLFLFISKGTREGIGYGDSLGIFALGIYLGIWKLAEVLCVSFFLLFFAAMFLFFKKKNRKHGIPFYPFLAAGYLLVLLLEGGNGR